MAIELFLSTAEQPLPPLLLLSAVTLFLLPLVYLLFFRGSTNGIEARGRTENSAYSAQFPPGPPKLPVLGNLLQLGSLPHRYFQAVSRRYGPVVQVQLGSIRTVVVHSPEAAKDVFRTNDLHCCSRPPSPGPQMLSYNYRDIAFSPYGDYWREMRKLFVVELTSARRVTSFASARAAEVARLIDTLAADANPVDLSAALFTFADRITGTVAFGNVYGSATFIPSSPSSDQRGSGIHEVMEELTDMLGSFTFEDFFPSSKLAWWADVVTGVARKQRRVFRRVDGFLDAVINKHLEPERLRAGVQEDLVDAMVKMWREQKKTDNGDFQLTREHIKAVLMDILVGGIDTVAVTLTWIMSELMKNPRVMQKAQAEVRNAVKSKLRVSEEDIQNLKYLNMVIKENFRLHPTGTLLIPRQTMNACTIGGYSVPSGTRLHVNVWAMGRDPKIWNNPEEFYPERFEDTQIDFRGSHFQLLPFGSGRRICPGITMGVANVELAVANLLYCFNWQLPKGMKEDDIDMDEIGQLAFHKKVPLLIVPVKHGQQDGQ